MTNTNGSSTAVNRTVSQDDRAHPNWKSTIMSSPPSVRNISDPTRPIPSRLARGKLFSVQTKFSSAGTGPNADLAAGPTGNQSTKVINTTLSKIFQYNPPELQMALSLSPINPDGTENSGGNLDGSVGLGAATTSVELLFDRTQEQHAGQQLGSRYQEFARLGVAKDILDVYAVIKGDEAMLANEEQRSISALTSEMTDLVARGSTVLQGSQIALAYSKDFVIFGYVTSMNFRFVKFNHMLIPTMGFVSLSIDIFNAGNQRLVYNQFGIDESTTPRGSSGSSTLSGATGSPASEGPWYNNGGLVPQ